MRRRGSTSAIIMTCLLVVGPVPAVVAQAAEPADASRAGSLTVEVADLAGMEGLELAGAVWGGPMDLLHVPIDEPVFYATDTVDLKPGSYYVWIFAGEPPCGVGFTPYCGPNQDLADYFCMFDLDILPGDHVLLGLSGLPAHEPEEGGDVHPCPVTAVRYLSSSPASDES